MTVKVSRRAASIVRNAYEAIPTFENKMFGEMFAHALHQKVYNNNPAFYDFMGHLSHPPVDIETFLDSPEFLGATDLVLWPEVRRAVIEINIDWWRGARVSTACAEAVLCGATSTGKSSISMVTVLYHLHILSCLKVPQAIYGLPSATSIVFAIQAAKPHVTKKVLYMPMRKMVEDIPYFRKHLKLNPLIESEMYFEDKNIRIVPGGTDADSILGEAIIGGIIDEINFMNVVLKSKKAEVSSGRAGVYDQATTIHSAMTKRKKGRFTYQGPLIGVICTSSSTRYSGDFTDKRLKQIKEHHEKNVFVYNRAQYEVHPPERYSGETFRIAVGNEVNTDTRVLREDEQVTEGAMVLEVPVEYRDDFLRDPHSALRDVCGISTSGSSPFFKRRFKITECVLAGEEIGLTSFLQKDNVILGVDGMPIVNRGHYCVNPSRPRYVHIDLSHTGDRVGIVMLAFTGMESVGRTGGATEMLPTCNVELACSIEPDGNNEIMIAEVRSWVKQLKSVYGYPIKAVSYDGWASLESRQQWKKEGMKAGLISVDRSSVPYKQLRDGINDGRIRMFQQDILISELYELEYDEIKDKVDHPVRGGKDIADALCGAYNLMLQRRTSWIDAAGDDEANSRSMRASYEDRSDSERPL